MYSNDLRTEDNSWHNALVEFDNGNVEVSVDGQIVLVQNITNPNYAYSGIGFSAGTGLGTNNHVIDDFVLMIPTGAAIPVSSCLNIAISCIQITSSNVIFNGNNHTIDGIDAEKSNGVNVDNLTATTLTNVTVKNLIVTDWINGIKYSKVTNGRIEENNANSNTVGIQIVSSNNNILKNNIATKTPFGGSGIGIYDSNFNTLTGNIANNNGGTGIILDVIKYIYKYVQFVDFGRYKGKGYPIFHSILQKYLYEHANVNCGWNSFLIYRKVKIKRRMQ